MSSVIPISGSSTIAMLDAPQSHTEVAVLFFPGVSGGALTDRFVSLARAITDAGMALLRVEIWEDENELQLKTIGEIFDKIDAAVTHLQGQGYVKIFGVGKSFGGALLLSRNHPDLNALSLWAPAMGYSSAPSFERFKNVHLGNIEKTLDITLSEKALSEVSVPVQFIHSDADSTIPLENSQELASHLDSALVEIIPGMQHSPKTVEHENALIEKTVAFLRDK